MTAEVIPDQQFYPKLINRFFPFSYLSGKNTVRYHFLILTVPKNTDFAVFCYLKNANFAVFCCFKNANFAVFCRFKNANFAVLKMLILRYFEQRLFKIIIFQIITIIISIQKISPARRANDI